MDLVITGGTVITPDGCRQADVAVAAGRIAAIGSGLRGATQLDAAGRYVLPGAIDAHVHCNAPVGAYTSTDDFFSGTVAALCGGTTTIIDFAEPDPGETLLPAFRRRRAEADPRVAGDYALHIVVPNDDPDNLAHIPTLIAEGCTSFKLFLAYEGVCLNDDQLINVLGALKAHSGFPMVHAENYAAIKHLCKIYLEQGKLSPQYHPRSRPSYLEGEAVARAIGMARMFDHPMYIAHVSCAEALRAIEDAQQAGAAAFGETCPHYLLFTADDCARPGMEGAKFVMSPPLRGRRDQDLLWSALAGGQLQAVATDHCAFFYAGMKDAATRFTDIPNGVPGVEARLSLIYTYGVCAGRLSLTRWVEVCCAEPARLFGLAPRKGRIAIGADADLVIFDPNRSLVLTPALLHERTDYTPYDGLRLQGYPETTILRGQIVAQGGQFVGHAGQGRYIPCQLSDTLRGTPSS